MNNEVNASYGVHDLEAMGCIPLNVILDNVPLAGKTYFHL